MASAEKIPEPTGWVNDFANVISQDYETKLTDLIQEVEKKTSAEIAVLTVESIAPYDEKEYARLIFDKWKIGKKGKDNGVLVLLAVKERFWRIEVGYGLEGTLPDGLCGEIGRKYMVPYFKEAKYGEGLYYGTSAIAKVIYGEGLKKSEASALPGMPEPILFYILLVIFILLIMAPLLFQRERSHYGGTRGYPGGYGGWGGGGGFGGGGFGGGGFGGFGGGMGGGGGAGGKF